MNFLLDVNASGFVAHFLTDMGHDVIEVGRVDSRMSDSEILRWAVRESRVIVTTDNDFEEMVWLSPTVLNCSRAADVNVFFSS